MRSRSQTALRGRLPSQEKKLPMRSRIFHERPESSRLGYAEFPVPGSRLAVPDNAREDQKCRKQPKQSRPAHPGPAMWLHGGRSCPLRRWRGTWRHSCGRGDPASAQARSRPRADRREPPAPQGRTSQDASKEATAPARSRRHGGWPTRCGGGTASELRQVVEEVDYRSLLFPLAAELRREPTVKRGESQDVCECAVPVSHAHSATHAALRSRGSASARRAADLLAAIVESHVTGAGRARGRAMAHPPTRATTTPAASEFGRRCSRECRRMRGTMQGLQPLPLDLRPSIAGQ